MSSKTYLEIAAGTVFWDGSDGSWIWDDRRRRLASLNATSRTLLSFCDRTQTKEEVVAATMAAMSAPPQARSELDAFLTKLLAESWIEPVAATPPRNHLTAYLSLTEQCNLKCSFCFARQREKSAQRLKTDDWLRIISELAELGKGKTTVIVTGGEPTLSQHFLTICEAIKAQGLRLEIFTNGTLITPEIAEKLAKLAPDYMGVSLDGATAERHDSIRGDGNFAKTIAGLDLLMAKRVPHVSVQTVVTRENLHELDQLVHLLEKHAIGALQVGPIDPLGDGRNTPELHLNIEQEIRLMEWVAHRQSIADSKVRVGRERDTSKSSRPGLGVCGLDRMLHINVNGKVTPCPAMLTDDAAIGSVRDLTLRDLISRAPWFKSGEQDPLEDLKQCRRCGFRRWCQAGCRARAAEAGHPNGCDEKQRDVLLARCEQIISAHFKNA